MKMQYNLDSITRYIDLLEEDIRNKTRVISMYHAEQEQNAQLALVFWGLLVFTNVCWIFYTVLK